VTTNFRFTGHDTFACRATWLHKGLNYLENNDLTSITKGDAVVPLGVGKNMLQAIRHWVRAFNLVNEEGKRTPESKLIGTQQDQGYDYLLESSDSLWMLHLNLIQSGYASIYPIFFKEFFKRKSSGLFTEEEFIRFLKSYLLQNNSKSQSEKTLRNDFNVLLDMYCPKATKGQEDSLTNLLTDLNLIMRTEHKSKGETVYELNHSAQASISTRLFAAMMFTPFSESLTAGFDDVFGNVGLALGMTREGFLERIDTICSEFPEHFVFKEDAGLRVIQCAAYHHKEEFRFQTELNEAC
jgi:hypothetical protein